MLSSYQSGLRTRVIDVARGRLLILAASAAACIFFRVGHLPLPSESFVIQAVWTAIALAGFLVALRVHDARRLVRLGGVARLAVTLPVGEQDRRPDPAAAAERENPAPAPDVHGEGLAPSAPPQRPPGSRPQVLVIDDEDVIRFAMRRWFVRHGWDVLEAANGRIALDMLVVREREHMARLEPDVILCDLRMPGMSGMALHEHLRSERPDLVRRLIFSTGDVVSPEAAAFLSGTECPVLEKPFELEVLASTVDRVLRTPLWA